MHAAAPPTDQEPADARKAAPRAATIPPARGANKPRETSSIAVGSPEGVVPPGSRRSRCEPLDSPGSCRPKDRADRLVGCWPDYYLSMRYDGGDDVDDASRGGLGWRLRHEQLRPGHHRASRPACTDARSLPAHRAFTASIATRMTAVDDQPGIGWLLLLLLYSSELRFWRVARDSNPQPPDP